MLAEVLLVLAGHPSSFFTPHPPQSPTTLRLTPSLERYLHPGEIASLNTLGDIAHNYASIKLWATLQLESTRQAILLSNRKGKQKALDPAPHPSNPCVYTSTLASAILDSLRSYEEIIVELEMKILKMDTEVVQDSKGYVPLSIIVASFSHWITPLQSLHHLVATIQRDKPTPGGLIDLVRARVESGHPELRRIYVTLANVVERLFIRHLTVFVLFGQAPTGSSGVTPSIALDTGADALSPRHRMYELNTDLVPSSVGGRTRESLMYVGRVAATLKREGRDLPRGLIQELQEAFEGVTQERNGRGVRGLEGLDEAVDLARREVGEWLWRHVLTGHQIIESLEMFGNYFLTRRADYAISVIHEVTKLCQDKLLGSKPESSSSVVRDTDLQLAWLRASVGTSAEHDKSLDKLRLKFDHGPLRAIPTSDSARGRSETSMFSDLLCGTGVTLHPTISWPLDLFMTPPSRATYCEIHGYLFALRTTQYRLHECWSSLTASRKRGRAPRDHETIEEREYVRTTWATVKLILFWLDEVLNHFMGDIIDVQHRNLLSQLDPTGKGDEGMKRSGSMGASVRGSTRHLDVKSDHGRPGERGTRAGSPASTYAAETVKSKVPPVVNTHTAHMDFLSLRQMHSRHLAFLKQGLLLADQGLSVVIRDILDTCVRFAATIERWGGDLFPRQDETDPRREEKEEEVIAERFKVINDIKAELHDQLSDFFRALVESQNPSADTGDGSTGVSGSFTKTVRTTQMIHSSRVFSRQMSFTGVKGGLNKTGVKSIAEVEKSERDQEAENLMSRHVEQLLLRLDYNGVFTAWLDQENSMAPSGVLAEGGL